MGELLTLQNSTTVCMKLPIYKLYYSQIQEPTFLDILTYKLLSSEFDPFVRLSHFIDRIRYRKIQKTE